MIPIFHGKVEGGKLTLDDQKSFRMWLNFVSGEVSLVLEPRRKKRSLKENNYYWKILTMIGDHLGYTSEDMHSIFGQLFLLVREQNLTFVRSTKKLTTVEFEDYLAKIRMYCSQEFNFYVPEPGEVAPGVKLESKT